MHSRLEAFLYRIGRDNLPLGVVEEQVRVAEEHAPAESIVYLADAAALGEWAKMMAHRLMPAAPEPLSGDEREAVRDLIALTEAPYAHCGQRTGETMEEYRDRAQDDDDVQYAARWRKADKIIRRLR